MEWNTPNSKPDSWTAEKNETKREKMLSNRLRTFQQIHSNRLQHHPFLFIVNKYVRNQTFTQANVINVCHRFQHTRCNAMTQKDQTPAHRLSAADLNYQLSSSSSTSPSPPNHREIASTQLLPFDSIPCADDHQSHNICGRFYAFAHKLKQLLTAQWDNRFHEEIDECHRRYGPIFRKTLAQNQGVCFYCIIHDFCYYYGN